MEKSILKTSDGVSIAAFYWAANEPKGWIVYLHMMPVTKESWIKLAESLGQAGYSGIAIDLRGHGESDGGPNGFMNFSDSEHQKSILDVNAAVAYLKENGAEEKNIYFIGASIGANLALQKISENINFKKAVLLSPGLNYRGIKTELLVLNLKLGQKVLFITSKDDGANFAEVQSLYAKIPQGVVREIKIYQNAGHGTTILEKDPALINTIIQFIKLS